MGDRECLRQVLRCSSGFEVTDLVIAVKEGSVVISGGVDSLRNKYLLEARIAAVEDVRHVESELYLSLAKDVEDREITAALQEALVGMGAAVSPTSIRIRVWNARVRLVGVVHDLKARLAAGEVASRVPGVVDVENNLMVM